MSTLVCWVGVDPRGVASAYIATDSRISFGGTDTGQIWDTGQKCYCSTLVPFIAGYVGSAFYPAHLIPRLATYAEAIWQLHESANDLLHSLCEFVTTALSGAPENDHFGDVEMVVAFRFRNEEFTVAVIVPGRDRTGYVVKPLPIKSGVVHSCGSGASFLRRKVREWQRTHAADTSRAVYSALCDSLLYVNPPDLGAGESPGKDPASEGPPQLVGIYRKWAGRCFGVVWKGNLYLAGIKVPRLGHEVQCRNDLFELCSPETLKPLTGAKRHRDEPTLTKRDAIRRKSRRG